MRYKCFLLFSILILLVACGHENQQRSSQFDLLEECATKAQLKYQDQELKDSTISIGYPDFNDHPFAKLMAHLIMLDTTGVFCIEQRQIKINYKVLWATDQVLSLRQEIWMDCPMSEMPRSTVQNWLFTRKGKRISRLLLEGSPGLLQELNSALRKRKAPYCSAPKIEEVFPIIHKGRIEVTPHYASSLCDTTFVRPSISRTDLRITRNQSFLVLP